MPDLTLPLLVAQTGDTSQADLILLIVYVLLALGVSSMCSIFEAVLLSVTPAYAAALVKKDDPAGARWRKLKDDVDRPLAAILSLNTIAHTIGAAGAGAQAVKVWGDTSVGIFSAVLTFLILVLSEIIPKSLGAAYWRKLAPVVSRLLIWLIYSVFPLVWLARGLTQLIGRGHDAGELSRDEISAMAEEGADRGVLEASESRILKNLFRFSSLQAKDVMTPRTVMFSLPQTTLVREVLKTGEDLRFSRIPIYRESPDDIAGYVLLSDILMAAAKDQHDRPLADFSREMQMIPPSTSLAPLFDRLVGQRANLALVVDEYGGTSGLVTVEDLVETLLGLEIVDEVDEVHDMQELAREQWRARARRLGIIEEEASPAPGPESPPNT